MRVLAALVLLLAFPAFSEKAAGPDTAEYRQRLEEILSRREFKADPRRLEAPEAPPLSAWTQGRIAELRVWVKKIQDWLRPEEREAPPPGRRWGSLGAIPQAASWTLGGLGLLLLAILAWRMLRTPPAGGSSTSAADMISMGMPDALSRAPEAWRMAADGHAAKGEWKLALRACYLALLNELHTRRILRYARERTNGEYVSALAAHPAGESFARLTVAFDAAWYGTLTFGEMEYRDAETLAEAVDGATVPVSAAGAAA